MSNTTPPNRDPVHARLIQAALESFLADDYHNVTTRAIAEKAGVNVSMIRYYFGNKEGLFEEMIRDTMQPCLDMLESQMFSTMNGFADYFRLYYNTMNSKPEFPKLILKILAFDHGPGRRFIQQLLERGRRRGTQAVNALQKGGAMEKSTDPDIVRIAFVSLAMMPMLLKSIFEEQLDHEMDESFLNQLAQFNGRLFAQGMAPEH